jgi:hypothetical protein
MDIMDKMKDLDKFGINLKLKTEEDEIVYCEVLRQWFEDMDNYTSFIIDDREFGLDYISGGEESSITIYIQDSAIRFSPVSGDPYYAVMDVLQFIAEMHKDVVEALESRRTVTEEDVVEEESEESSSSTDWEWI